VPQAFVDYKTGKPQDGKLNVPVRLHFGHSALVSASDEEFKQKNTIIKPVCTRQQRCVR
jgi:hypothetical protein